MRMGKVLANVDIDVLGVVMTNWRRVFGESYVSTTQVMERLPNLDSVLKSALAVFVDDNRRVPLTASTLGLRLRQSVGLQVFGLRIAAVFDGHQKSNVWRVERVADGEETLRRAQREVVAAEIAAMSGKLGDVLRAARARAVVADLHP